jgi:hypothetical protein
MTHRAVPVAAGYREVCQRCDPPAALRLVPNHEAGGVHVTGGSDLGVGYRAMAPQLAVSQGIRHEPR